MPIISTYCKKGGVGKTTLLGYLAHYYSIKGKIIDQDGIIEIIKYLITSNKLERYLNRVMFHKVSDTYSDQLYNCACMDQNERMLHIYIKDIMSALQLETNRYSHLFKKEELIFFSNACLIQNLLHEIEHVIQNKEMEEKDSLEAKIARWSSLIVYKDVSPEELEKKKAILDEKKQIIQQEEKDAYSVYTMNHDAYNKLLDLDKNNKAAINHYNDLKKLHYVSEGRYPGAKKVNFEVYYQLQVFGEIIKVASAKYYSMTDGKYELVPGEPYGGGQIGLDIDVKDVVNGGVRPCSTLSGGESFQASLVLALALSEVIKAKAGGIELNSMFIDEGFGTLDDTMLENTKKALLSTGDSVNRRIGIISHIEKLEKSISSKIIVTKNNQGSSIKIVNN